MTNHKSKLGNGKWFVAAGHSRSSILTQRAVNLVTLDVLEAFALMALRADRRPQNPAVFETRVCVNLMAVQTGDRFIAVERDIADVAPDVAVSRVQFLVIGPGPIQFQILKQIVARHEIVRVRQP